MPKPKPTTDGKGQRKGGFCVGQSSPSSAEHNTTRVVGLPTVRQANVYQEALQCEASTWRKPGWVWLRLLHRDHCALHPMAQQQAHDVAVSCFGRNGNSLLWV
eukprot:TRINITY_DN11064_c0_g1_i1.p3 TRINITY_DN11064_c0_g1~~TRINITY_DN11064_c0_g1_i1.p3  ORF type:complete len:103 (-),score=5.43 TRINITY_DN11064_c0_g1_i1:120-428(-)